MFLEKSDDGILIEGLIDTSGILIWWISLAFVFFSSLETTRF